jgi:hypothetical protein
MIAFFSLTTALHCYECAEEMKVVSHTLHEYEHSCRYLQTPILIICLIASSTFRPIAFWKKSHRASPFRVKRPPTFLSRNLNSDLIYPILPSITTIVIDDTNITRYSHRPAPNLRIGVRHFPRFFILKRHPKVDICKLFLAASNPLQTMDVKEQFRPTTMTFPIVVVGTVLGSLVCTSNMYFGLSIGTLNLMSTPVALLAYMVFHSALPRQKFTPTENVVVLAIASSIASMPIAASLWSVVPSFEKLREPDEGGRRTFTMFQLITWSFGVSLFGIAFSAPLRPFFLLKQQLAFPTASATGMLVKLLHNDGRLANLDTNVCHHSHTSPREVDAPLITSSGSSQLDDSSEYERFRYTDKLAIMLKAAVGTTAYVSTPAPESIVCDSNVK